MMYLVTYEVMDSDISIIDERSTYISLVPIDDVLQQLTRELRTKERNAVILHYALEDEDIFLTGEYLC